MNWFRQGRGRNIKRVVESLTPILRGWVNYFRLAEVKGIPIPKKEGKIDEILNDFIKTTRNVISSKRKNSIAENDIFVAVVRVLDGYSSRSTNYQALVNSMNNNNVVVVFEGPTALYIGDNVVKDRVTIYFNELNNFNKDEIFFIRNIFS